MFLSATVLRQLATDIANGSYNSLETVASDSLFPRMCRLVVAKILNMFKILCDKILRKRVAKSSGVS